MQSEADYEEVVESLETHKQIAQGTPGHGYIAALDIDRFAGSRLCSSIIQASPAPA